MPLYHTRFSDTADGLVPAPNSGTATDFLREDGTWQAAGGGTAIIDTDSTETALTNTTTETTIYSGTIPGGTLGTENAVHVFIGNRYLNNSGAGRTFTLRVKLNGTAVYEDATASLTNGALLRPLNIRLMLAAFAATNAQKLFGCMEIGVGTATTGDGGMETTTNSLVLPLHASPTVDSTANITFSVTIQHSVADVNLSFVREYVSVRTEGLPSEGLSAAAISFSPTGNIAATNVQAAIAEVATDAASDTASGTASVSYNLTSITDGGVGLMTANIATDFSSANWCAGLTIENIDASIDASTDVQCPQIGLAGQAAGSLACICGNASGTAAVDPTQWHVSGLGDL